MRTNIHGNMELRYLVSIMLRYDFPNARLPVWSEARKLHGKFI